MAELAAGEMQRMMLIVGCNCWDEEVWDKCCDPPGWARPRLGSGTSIGGVVFLSMMLTGTGSMVMAASGRRNRGPEIQQLPMWWHRLNLYSTPTELGTHMEGIYSY